MTVTEKVSYLKGLAEGLGIDENEKNGKVIKAIIDVLDDLAFTVADLEDGFDELIEQVDALTRISAAWKMISMRTKTRTITTTRTTMRNSMTRNSTKLPAPAAATPSV